jgi:hypothetical protein
MPETTCKIKRLQLSAPDEGSAKDLAQSVANELHKTLPRAGVSGKFGHLHVRITAAEATDPSAISRAIVRAMKGGAA